MNKVPITFSVEFELLAKFKEALASRGVNKNELLETWIKRFLSPELLTCDKCGAVYSELLKECPNCKPNVVTNNG